MRGRALPLRIAGREVAADISIAQGAQKRVRCRMEADIGIGMTGKALAMGHGNAAKHDLAALRKAVNVITGTR
jgi:hypothetical protein